MRLSLFIFLAAQAWPALGAETFPKERAFAFAKLSITAGTGVYMNVRQAEITAFETEKGARPSSYHLTLEGDTSSYRVVNVGEQASGYVATAILDALNQGPNPARLEVRTADAAQWELSLRAVDAAGVASELKLSGSPGAPPIGAM